MYCNDSCAYFYRHRFEPKANALHGLRAGPGVAWELWTQVFKSKNVTDIVRLNSPEYDEREFVNAGFKFHDLFFTGLLLL